MEKLVDKYLKLNEKESFDFLDNLGTTIKTSIRFSSTIEKNIEEKFHEVIVGSSELYLSLLLSENPKTNEFLEKLTNDLFSKSNLLKRFLEEVTKRLLIFNPDKALSFVKLYFSYTKKSFELKKESTTNNLIFQLEVENNIFTAPKQLIKVLSLDNNFTDAKIKIEIYDFLKNFISDSEIYSSENRIMLNSLKDTKSKFVPHLIFACIKSGETELLSYVLENENLDNYPQPVNISEYAYHLGQKYIEGRPINDFIITNLLSYTSLRAMINDLLITSKSREINKESVKILDLISPYFKNVDNEIEEKDIKILEEIHEIPNIKAILLKNKIKKGLANTHLIKENNPKARKV